LESLERVLGYLNGITQREAPELHQQNMKGKACEEQASRAGSDTVIFESAGGPINLASPNSPVCPPGDSPSLSSASTQAVGYIPLSAPLCEPTDWNLSGGCGQVRSRWLHVF
jgi:hypothetical protein